jgi:hypothetical protein
MSTQRARAFRKHRLASDVYGVDSAERLSDGESLSGVPAVVVTQEQPDGSFDDVSRQFGISGSQVTGTRVAFRPGDATTGDSGRGRVRRVGPRGHESRRHPRLDPRAPRHGAGGPGSAVRVTPGAAGTDGASRRPANRAYVSDNAEQSFRSRCRGQGW